MAPVIVIAGPTAVGKTEVAVAFAKKLGNAELVNADSRQVRQGCTVGTCAPTPEQLMGVQLHLSGYVSLRASYSVWEWVRDARSCLMEMRRRGKTAILVGGTGLFLEVLLSGWSLAAGAKPDTVRLSRSRLAAQPGGVELLAAALLERDPLAVQTVDMKNPRRVMRALEQLDAGYPSVAAARGLDEPVPAVSFLLDMERGLSESIIHARAEKMIQAGTLLLEIRELSAYGYSDEEIRRGGIGYPEGLELRDGRITEAVAIERIALRTRRYAKAQRTWFRHHLNGSTPIRMDQGAAAAVDAIEQVISG